MKKIKTLFLPLLLITVTMLFSSCHTVPAGNVGIKFYLLGGEKGVDYEVLSPGRYPALNWNRKFYNFPTQMQNIVWTANKSEGSTKDESIVFQTNQGLPCYADIGLTYHAIPEKIPLLFESYKSGITEITDIFLRNMIRDAIVAGASNRPVEQIYGSGKMDLIKEAQDHVQAQVADLGIIIDKLYWIGNIRLPEQVTSAINAKIEAEEKAMIRENEIAESKATALKRIEEAKGIAESRRINAKAEADANRLISNSLTPSLINYMKADKWNGVLPTYTGGSIPMISLK